jgi:hypothetical protein
MQPALKLSWLMLIAALPMVAADPFTGTWKLNIEKSRTTAAKPASPPQSLLVTYAGEGDAMKTIVRVTMADGVERTMEHAVPRDGKEHPRFAGAPDGDTITTRLIDKFTEESVQKKDGRITVTTVRVVSRNGKTMTATARSTSPDGVAVETVSVYDRQ